MSYDPTKVAFVDTETTHLDDRIGEVWEIGLIVPSWHGSDVERRMVLRIDETRADPMSLEIGGYHERHPHGRRYDGQGPHKVALTKHDVAAKWVATLLHGRHAVGAVPDFDYRFLRNLLRDEGYAWTASYHLIDVEALTVGWLRRGWSDSLQDDPNPYQGLNPPLPWKSRELSRAVGVDPDRPEFAQHTALGDARWARACFEAVMGEPEVPS